MMLEARHQYVSLGAPLSLISIKEKISREALEDWSEIGGWEVLRHRHLQELRRKVRWTARATIDAVDAKTSKLFKNMLAMIGDIVERALNQGTELSVAEVRGLTAAARDCLNARRYLLGEVELKKTVPTKVAAALTGNGTGPLQLSTEDMVGMLESKSAGAMAAVSMDVEYEESA